MKILKINKSQGYFVNKDNMDVIISDISKDDLYYLLKKSYENDVEMDSLENNEILNDSQKIIYSKIYEEIAKFINSKADIKEQIEREFTQYAKKYD